MRIYKNSSAAFNDIHASMGEWINGLLDGGLDSVDTFDEAIMLAFKMREIEYHTDIEDKPESNDVQNLFKSARDELEEDTN